MPSSDRPTPPDLSGLEPSLSDPGLLDSIPSHLTLMDPSALEMRLGELIRHYVRARSAALAHSVVRHIEALCLHPEQRDPALFCAYRRLAVHWRWLAAQHGLAGT